MVVTGQLLYILHRHHYQLQPRTAASTRTRTSQILTATSQVYPTLDLNSCQTQITTSGTYNQTLPTAVSATVTALHHHPAASTANNGSLPVRECVRLSVHQSGTLTTISLGQPLIRVNF